MLVLWKANQEAGEMSVRDIVVFEIVLILFFGMMGVILVSNFLLTRNIVSLCLGLLMCLAMYIGIFVMWLKLRNAKKDLERY